VKAKKILLIPLVLFSISAHASQEPKANNRNSRVAVNITIPESQDWEGSHEHIPTRNLKPRPVYDDTGTYLYSVFSVPVQHKGRVSLLSIIGY